MENPCMSMKKATWLTLIAALSMTACSWEPSNVQQTVDGYLVETGRVQKGPLRRGSVVTINELDSQNLAPSGKSYTFETLDDRGTFMPTSKFGSPYLETTAQGYYFNEVTGKSDQWTALRGLSNLAEGADKAVNINVLSDMISDRIRVLVRATPTLGFTAARAQAQRELLDAFGIFNGTDVMSDGAGQAVNFTELDLSTARASDQVLAAISSLVAYVGNQRKDNGGVTPFLSEIGSDLADDGELNNSIRLDLGVKEQLQQAALGISLGKVVANLNRLYPNMYYVGDLSQWLDLSGGADQVIERYKYAAENVLPGSESRSPAWTAGSDDAGQCISVTGGTLYRNGVPQGSAVIAAKGDQLSMGLQVPATGTRTEYLRRSAPAAGLCPSSAKSIRLLQYTVSAASSDAVAVPADYVGANLPNITDYAYTPVYVDLVHQGRPFGHPDHPWGGENDRTPLGSDGWPTGDFGIFLMTRSGMDGVYKGSFTGKADIFLIGSAYTSIANRVYDAEHNRTTFDVVRGPGAGTVNMTLSFKNTQLDASSPKGSGIKDLKVIRPGYDPVNPPLFTTEFLQHIDRFQVLRFMDWTRTNNNTVTRWGGRSTLDTHTMTSAGVPWEHVVALANQTHKDIWINIPVSADNDYVLQLALLLKSTLNADSRIYVEYSNELWNSSFWQFGTNMDLATAEVYANPNSTLTYDGSTDRYTLGFRRIAKRSKEISDIFRSVYGDAAMMSTVRPVFAGQVVQPYIAQVGLQFIEAVYGPPARYFYAYAGAPYFNLGKMQQVDGLSVDAVLQAMNDSVTALPTVNAFEKNLAFTRWYGLPFVAYEGGSDTFGPGSIAAKKDASLDPRMLDICKRYMSTWYAYGGSMFMWYTAGAGSWDTQYGTWELTTDLSTDTPKLQCIDQIRTGVLPVLQGRNKVPGSFSTLASAGNFEPYSDGSKTTLRYLHPGSFLDYVLLAPKAGTYQLVITAEAQNSGNTIDVHLNGKPVATGFEFKAKGWGNPVDNAAITVNMPQGFSTLRIRTKTENLGYSMSKLTFK